MLLKQFSESIEKHGVLKPITVRKSGKDFTIVMGERRYRASKLAGKKTIPCIVRTHKDNDGKFKSPKIYKDRMLNLPKKPKRLLT
jgi:ParB/RepB/Spo0J family partition protein